MNLGSFNCILLVPPDSFKIDLLLGLYANYIYLLVL